MWELILYGNSFEIMWQWNKKRFKLFWGLNWKSLARVIKPKLPNAAKRHWFTQLLQQSAQGRFFKMVNQDLLPDFHSLWPRQEYKLH